MVPIPTRADLAEMLRADIQKLCKDNNIKANMRTEDMIDALCGLASSGKDKTRTQRTTSQRTVSQASRPASGASVMAQDPPSPKKTRHVSEPNTDAGSTTDTPPAPPTTRRKAKEIQIHLGKGRPAVAGGSGARTITKRRSRASAAIAPRQEPILEEDEENVVDTNTNTNTNTVAATADIAPSPPKSPGQLPTPAPSHPSHSIPSTHQIAALETRIAQLESVAPVPVVRPTLDSDPSLQERLREIETSTSHIASLQAAVAPIFTLEARLEAMTQYTARLEADLTKHTARLGTELERILAENEALRERVSFLEARVQTQDSHDQGKSDADTKEMNVGRPATSVASSSKWGKRVGSMIIRSPEPEEQCNETEKKARPGTPAAPSPAQPTLGKRTRKDTPGADASTEAIERVIRPVRKRARLDGGHEDVPFSTGIGAPSFPRIQGGPSSTSTPRARHSDSPPGFFTVGRRAPTPLARRKDDIDVDVDVDLDAYINLGEEPEEAVAGPSSVAMDSPKTSGQGQKTPDPGFLESPPAVFFTPGSTLAYPLNPTTPPPVPIPEMYTPRGLGPPWRPARTPTPTHGPQTQGSGLTQAAHLHDHPAYTFRGGRRERNDRYNPYFTPGPRERTGLTPPPAASVLGSPAKVEGVGDGNENELEEAVAPLRTLYGTELEGDTRFGDFGANLGRFDWSKYAR